MNYINVAISEIKPFAKNNKKHPAKQVEMIANSIKEFGFKNPIIIDKNNEIIAWHWRYLAAQQLWLETAPCIVADDLTKEQVRAYRLLDNKIWDFGEYDMGNILEELWDIWDFQLWLDSLNDIFEIKDKSKEEIEDEIPEVKTPPIVQVWDIFQLGRHRIMCWDSTKKEDVDKLMDGIKADVSFTSPPYNVWHNLWYKDKGSKYINSDDNLDDYVGLLTNSTSLSLINAEEVFINLQLLANNKKDIIVWLYGMADNFKDVLFRKKSQVAPAMANNVANSQVELIFIFSNNNNNRARGNKLFRWNFSNLIETNSAATSNDNSDIHNATFPISLLELVIDHWYKDNIIVLDLFIWTGTVLIYCEKTNRTCYWMELDPKYIEVIIKRYYDYTNGWEDIKCVNRDLDLSIITNGE